MRRDLWAAARWLAAATAAVLGVAAFLPGRLELALRIYALILAAAVIVLALHALRRAFPPESESTLTGSARRAQQQPAGLTAVRNEVVLGVASSFDLHYRLAPRLRAIADELLATRRNVVLATDTARARAILGPETWELVRPDRPAPLDRRANGVTPEQLGHAIDTLEAT